MIKSEILELIEDLKKERRKVSKKIDEIDSNIIGLKEELRKIEKPSIWESYPSENIFERHS